jgi:hypothetical protein
MSVLVGCGREVPEADYALLGGGLARISPEPYSRTAESALSLEDENWPVDNNGVAQYELPWERGTLLYHPVNLAQYGLHMLESFRATEDPAYLERAVLNGQALVEGSEMVDDARWFGYDWDHRLHGDDILSMPAPWYSGMGQGQALSLFVRLYQETGEDQWLEYADETFTSFTIERTDDGPWFTHMVDGNLWFEEYVADGLQDTHIVNGHMYAMFGLYDYALETGDEWARQLFDGGAATMVTTFESFRVPEGISYYCAADYCRENSWQPESYHRELPTSSTCWRS